MPVVVVAAKRDPDTNSTRDFVESNKCSCCCETNLVVVDCCCCKNP